LVRAPPTKSACQQQRHGGAGGTDGGQSRGAPTRRACCCRTIPSTAARMSSAVLVGTGAWSSSKWASEAARIPSRPTPKPRASRWARLRRSSSTERTGGSSSRSVPLTRLIARMEEMPKT
jgi:hypothetical protein